MSIFKRKKPPGMELPFIHGTDCPIVRADPGYQPTWEKAEEGDAWRRICQCGSETIHVTDAAKKIDPYEPGTFRHAPQCDYRDVTDPAIIRAILTVKPARAATSTCGSRAATARSHGQYQTTTCDPTFAAQGESLKTCRDRTVNRKEGFLGSCLPSSSGALRGSVSDHGVQPGSWSPAEPTDPRGAEAVFPQKADSDIRQPVWRKKRKEKTHCKLLRP